QPVQPSVAIGVEPAGNGLAVDAQVGGDILACPAAVGHEDDLEAVAEFAVVGSTEEAVEAFGFGSWQLNTDQGAVLSQHGRGSVRLEDGTASMGSCMRSNVFLGMLARRRAPDWLPTRRPLPGCPDGLLTGRFRRRGWFNPECRAAGGQDQLALRGGGQRAAARLDGDRLRLEGAVEPARELLRHQVVH